ncbi:MAG: glycosyltransferase family 39 protein [Anaerolineaceae bacterium]
MERQSKQSKSLAMKRNPFAGSHVLLIIALIMAATLRFWMLKYRLLSINSDDAMIGIMAQRILAGARPLFYYGGYYYGPLDAYLAAPLIRIWGSSDEILRVFPLIFSLLFVVVTFLLGKKRYTEKIGLISAFYAAIPPVFLTVRGLKVDAAYSILLVIGSISLYLFSGWMEDRSRRRLVVLAILSLIGVWIFPLMLYYILAMALTFWLDRSSRCDRLRMGEHSHHWLFGMGVLFLIIIFLILGQYTSPVPLGERVTNLGGLVQITTPVLLGFFPAAENFSDFTAVFSRYPAFWKVSAAALGLIISGVGLWAGYKRYQQGNRLLFVFVTTTVLIFVLTSVMVGFKPEAFSYPRYLFLLYSAIPMGVDALMQLTDKKPFLRYGMIILILIVNLVSNINLPTSKPSMSGLKNLMMNRQGVSFVYTDYWTGYWLAYETDGKVIPSIITPDGKIGFNRLEDTAQAVSNASAVMYIFPAGSSGATALQRYLDNQKIQYQVFTVDERILFWGLSSPVRPGDF